MEPIIPQNLIQYTFDFDALGDQLVDDTILRVDSFPPQKQKYCSLCKRWLPATMEYWHSNKKKEDGLHGSCKDCKHAYYIANHPHSCIRCHIHIAIHSRLCEECHQWKQSHPDVKYCPNCKQWLSNDRFGRQSSAKDGLRRICKSCRHNECLAHPERTKEVVQKRRESFLAKSLEEQEEIRVYQRENYRERYAERKQAGMCRDCLTHPSESGRHTCNRCHAEQKQYRGSLRDQVFAAYGGKCVVCGETNPAFLSIDHINNDGAQHRRITGRGHCLYLWLRKNGFPQEGFQLLCSNHNWLKHLSQQSCSSQQSDKKIYMKIWYAALRQETIAAYGGKCVCCGESQTDVLTIDHVNNDGAQHRREVGGGGRFYCWLRKNNFPQEGFQALCFNCNRARYYYDVCPHQK